MSIFHYAVTHVRGPMTLLCTGVKLPPATAFTYESAYVTCDRCKALLVDRALCEEARNVADAQDVDR